MPRQDMEWIFEYTNETPDRVKLLGTMQPTSKFGEVFQYSNLMAPRPASSAVEGGSGKEWGRRTTRRCRRRSSTRSDDDDHVRLREGLKGNVALPHGEDIDGKPMRASMG
jgi:hypothetical protein